MVILDILEQIFVPVWALFTGTIVPGLGVSCATFLISIILIKLSVSLLRNGLGIGGGSSYRSGSAKNPKISAERKGDTY